MFTARTDSPTATLPSALQSVVQWLLNARTTPGCNAITNADIDPNLSVAESVMAACCATESVPGNTPAPGINLRHTAF